jgi:hypothetical protein
MDMKGIHLFIGLSGLLLLSLAACERDGIGNGKTVEVVFSARSAGYGTNDEILRRVKAKKPERVIVPLDDEFYFSATLMPDTANDLRAAVLLENNQKIKLAAFDGGTEVTGSPVTYTYSTGTGRFTPVGAPLGVEPGGTIYRFAAYSYYGDPTATPDETGITGDKDLVWGYADKAIPNTYTGREVDITMEHLFSRVKVRINAGEVATAMKNVGTVQVLGGKTAAFSSVEDGTLSEGSAVTQTVTGFSGTGVTQESGLYPFYKSPTQVTISSLTLTIGGTDRVFGPIAATFTEELLAGVNYVLVVDLKGRRFAWSNIYYSGGAMVFQTQPVTIGWECAGGIYFKWGSMIGIGARHNNSTNLGTANPQLNVYKLSGSTWTSVNMYWNDIPTWSLAEGNVGTPNANTSKGDICQYINSDYRLPRIEEFTEFGDLYTWTLWADNPPGWTVTGTFASQNPNANGTTTMTSYVTYAAEGGIHFPYSGCYCLQGLPNNPSVWMRFVGNTGAHWSSDPGPSGGYFLTANNAGIMFNGAEPPANLASPIRCIKKLPGE